VLRKLTAIFRIYLRECFAYPGASFIWVIADVQAALILPAVWLASAGPTGLAGGMDRAQLITYYLVTMTLSQFVICHLMWDLAWDIKDGYFSAQLLRPLDYFRTSLARNLSWRVAKLAMFLPILPVVTLAYGGLSGVSLHFSWAFIASALLAHMLSFLAAYALTMVSLWTTEFMSIFRLYYVPEMFLSGRVIPLSAMPPWAQTLGSFTHFPYMVSFPTKILLGELKTHEIWSGLGMQVGWCAVFAVLGPVLFSRGLRQYSGPGL